MRKAERLLAIILLLQVRGKSTAARLAAVLGVSVRTIYRDMEALSLAHVPVTMDYGPGGGYFLTEGYSLDPLTFTRDEATALVMGAALAVRSPLLEEGGLRRALIKLEALLPKDAAAELTMAGRMLLVDAADWHRSPRGEAHLGAVRAALLAQRRMEILHRRSDRPEPARRTVDPLGLVCKAGSWYLVAFCHLRNDFRVFRLDRIVETVLLDYAVQPRLNFDLRAYWDASRAHFESATAPIEIVARLSASAIPWFGEEFHVLQRERDGSSVIRLRTDRPERAIALLLSFGPEAELLQPPEIRQQMAGACREMAAQYRKEPASATT